MFLRRWRSNKIERWNGESELEEDGLGFEVGFGEDGEEGTDDIAEEADGDGVRTILFDGLRLESVSLNRDLRRKN